MSGNKKISLRLMTVLIFMGAGLWACKKDTPVVENAETAQQTEFRVVKNGILQIMKQYYLWNNTLPNVNVDSIATPQKLLDTLRNKQYDRYSFLTSKTYMQQLFQQGAYVGYGVSFKGDAQGNLRIAFLFSESPLVASGVQRGWIVKSVNGTAITPQVDITSLLGSDQAGVTNTFVMTDTLGVDHTITAAKQTIDMNTVLDSRVIDYAGEKVGYLAFESFVQTSTAELDTTFKHFSETGINDMVVDLRYNGGGLGEVALQMANFMVGDIASGRIFVRYEHNALNTAMNKSSAIANGGYQFGLRRVFYITSGSTASASEIMINGMKPIIPVYLVGDKTYGKPVGMYEWDFTNYDYALLPICFSITNENNEGGYYTGIPVDSPQPDDLTHVLGSPQEACLSAVLYYIKNGSFPASKKNAIVREGWGLDKISGFRSLIGAF